MQFCKIISAKTAIYTDSHLFPFYIKNDYADGCVVMAAAHRIASQQLAYRQIYTRKAVERYTERSLKLMDGSRRKLWSKCPTDVCKTVCKKPAMWCSTHVHSSTLPHYVRSGRRTSHDDFSHSPVAIRNCSDRRDYVLEWLHWRTSDVDKTPPS